MKKAYTALAVALAITVSSFGTVQASPEEDLKAFQGFFKDKFKDVEFSDYINGTYALDEDMREQWESIEEFPPYEPDIELGQELWEAEFANGKSYKDCFGEDVAAIRAKYPMYDEKADTVKTLEGEINACREANDEKPLKWKKGDIAKLSAYIAYEGRGNKIEVATPEGKALEWYEKGKNQFYAKRGQLNMACADCHVYNSGNKIRADLLSPALGQPSHFPVYRSKWGELGTLHRRYGGCNGQVRAKPFKAQSDEFKALEYFQVYMSNGLEWNGPGSRK